MKIGVVGLGKLGLCTAACLAKVHNVWGYDTDIARVDSILNGTFHTSEPMLLELLKLTWHRHSFTSSAEVVKEMLPGTEVVFIIVPTPTDPTTGMFSNEHVARVIKELVDLGLKNSIINIVSTVMPGSCDKELYKLVGSNHLTYNPEFIALGSTIRNFLNPDILLIGSESAAGRVVAMAYQGVVENKPIYAVMNWTEAELTKLLLNCYCTMKISFGNRTAELCKKFPNVNADNVLNALGCDSRIGTKLLKPGLGFGGPCFPRDVVALTKLRKLHQLDGQLETTIFTVNTKTELDAHAFIEKHANGRVLIMGIAYKKDGLLSEDSQALKLYRYTLLMPNITEIKVWDPVLSPVNVHGHFDTIVMMYDYSNESVFKNVIAVNPNCKVLAMTSLEKELPNTITFRRSTR